MEMSSPELNRPLSVAPVGGRGGGEAEAEVACVTQARLWSDTHAWMHTRSTCTLTQPRKLPSEFTARIRLSRGHASGLLWGLHEWAARKGETGVLKTAPMQPDGT